MLGIPSTPLFLWLKWTVPRRLSKSCPLLTTILPLRWYLKIVCSVGKKLETFLVIVTSNTIFFTHNIFYISVCRKKEAVFCIICIKAGNHLQHYTCHLIFASFLNKWIWKTRYFTFCTNLPKKERGSIYEKVTWQWPKKKRILLYGNFTCEWLKQMQRK